MVREGRDASGARLGTERVGDREEAEEDDDGEEEEDVIVRFESGVAARFPSSKPSSASRRRALSSASAARQRFLREKGESLTATSYYAKSLLADSISALTASFFVAIPVATIDRAIVQSVAGTKPLGQGLKEGFTEVVTRPLRTITRKSYLMVLGVYTATYLAANSFESLIAKVELDNEIAAASYEPFKAEKGMNEEEEAKAVQRLQFAKFLGVTAVNMAAAVSKDRAFARMYGTIAPSRLPFISWGCWISRDLLTIGAAFSLPKPLAKHLSNKDHPILSERWAGVAAQLIPVMLVQIISTPLHLAANDFYNFKRGEPRVHDANGNLLSGAKTTAERLNLLASQGPKAFVARLFRIAPAFGFGGIANTTLRGDMRKKLGVAF